MESGIDDRPDPPGGEGHRISVADEFAALGSGTRVLVVGSGLKHRPEHLHYDRLSADIDIADLDGLGTYELGVILELSERSDPVLARLRDVHTRRLIVTGAAAGQYRSAEMLALGFEAHEGPDGDGRAYLYDRDRFNRHRDWNSPEDWANPENFEKYRW